MKKYHLTFLRDGMQCTAFTEINSIAMFIAVEKTSVEKYTFFIQGNYKK